MDPARPTNAGFNHPTWALILRSNEQITCSAAKMGGMGPVISVSGFSHLAQDLGSWATGSGGQRPEGA